MTAGEHMRGGVLLRALVLGGRLDRKVVEATFRNLL
jgi:hypothetical protein